jgi:hypothetical protein
MVYIFEMPEVGGYSSGKLIKKVKIYKDKAKLKTFDQNPLEV